MIQPPQTILLVDDEPSVLAIVDTVLRRSGYSVIASSKPRDAMKHCGHGERIDLLLTDILMPDIEGTELAVLVRQYSPRTKVLYMTGHARTLPDAEVLRKPFTPHELLQRVRRILEPNALAASA